MKPIRLLAPIALIAALMLAGCSDAAEFGGLGDSTESSRGADGGNSAGGGPQVDEIDPSDVVASYEVPLPGGDEGDTLTVGLHSLQVDGDLMLLELYFTPNTDLTDRWSIYDMMNDRFAPVVLDVPNLTEYRTLSTIATTWESDVVYTEAGAGETVLWWGYFAAPPDDVQTVDIQLSGNHPRISDVELQR